MKPAPITLGAAVLLAALVLTLASCGRRGPLEPPPGAATPNAANTGAPGAYESPVTPADTQGQNTASSNPATAAGPAGGTQIPPPARKTFPLDPLL